MRLVVVACFQRVVGRDAQVITVRQQGAQNQDACVFDGRLSERGEAGGARGVCGETCDRAQR